MRTITRRSQSKRRYSSLHACQNWLWRHHGTGKQLLSLWSSIPIGLKKLLRVSALSTFAFVAAIAVNMWFWAYNVIYCAGQMARTPPIVGRTQLSTFSRKSQRFYQQFILALMRSLGFLILSGASLVYMQVWIKFVLSNTKNSRKIVRIISVLPLFRRGFSSAIGVSMGCGILPHWKHSLQKGHCQYGQDWLPS